MPEATAAVRPTRRPGAGAGAGTGAGAGVRRPRSARSRHSATIRGARGGIGGDGGDGGGGGERCCASRRTLHHCALLGGGGGLNTSALGASGPVDALGLSGGGTIGVIGVIGTIGGARHAPPLGATHPVVASVQLPSHSARMFRSALRLPSPASATAPLNAACASARLVVATEAFGKRARKSAAAPCRAR